jgi:hypothetical protein
VTLLKERALSLTPGREHCPWSPSAVARMSAFQQQEISENSLSPMVISGNQPPWCALLSASACLAGVLDASSAQQGQSSPLCPLRAGGGTLFLQKEKPLSG